MNPPWLFIDVSNLAYRAYNTTGRLAAGTAFGFLNQLKTLQARYQTRACAFCFDCGPYRREEALPTYKESRKRKYAAAPAAELAEKQTMRAEVTRLRTTILPELGYQNIFVSEGYEADDLIAACCLALPPRVESTAVIVGRDGDFYQLLSARIRIDRGANEPSYTQEQLAKEFFGLTPGEWPSVKAIAGCAGDDVKGIDGIGEIRAAQFLRGRLKEASVAYKKVEAGVDIWQRNLPLVRLPYQGTPGVELTDDEDTATPARWRKVAQELGMDSLLREPQNRGAGVFRRNEVNQ